MDLLTIAYILIAVGGVLLLAELFLPTGGIGFIGAALLLVAGVTLSFIDGDTTTGLLTLAIAFVGLPLLLSLVIYVRPPGLWGKPLAPSAEAMGTIAASPAYAELERLVNRIGRARSALRPAGLVDFDGKRVDCVSEGVMIDEDTYVRCVAVRAGRVVVRAVDAPDLKDLESDFGAA